MIRHSLALLALLTALPGCGEDIAPFRQVGRCLTQSTSPCEANTTDALQNALGVGFSACEGGAILLTGPSYSGAFTVPPGATILPDTDALGELRPAFTGDGERAVFVAEGNASICGVTIDNAAPAVVAANEGSALTLSGVTATTSRGGAVIAEGLARLNLHRTDLRSGLSESAIDAAIEPLQARETPIVGLVASRVASVTIEDTTAVGFVGFGAIFFESDGLWRGGGAVSGSGAGIFIDGGNIHLETVAIEGIRASSSPTGTAGVVAVGDALLTSRALSMRLVAGTGLFQDGSQGEHFGLVAESNEGPGIWLQDTGASAFFSTALTGNSGAGLVALGCNGLSAQDTTIEDTVDGDGVQLVGVSGLTELRRATLSNNARAGLLIDGAGEGDRAPAAFEFEGIKIAGEGDAARGIVLQDTAATPDGVDVEAPLSERTSDRITPFAPRNAPSVRALAEGGFVGGFVDETGRIAEGAIIDGGALISSP